MSASCSDRTAIWVTRRSHLQVSRTEVLPVVFKSRKVATNASNQENGPVPPAFPCTEVNLSESLSVVREWLVSHLERMYRVGTMNVKPGSLETPDVLRSRKYRFTLWFEPTLATFALMMPREASDRVAEREIGGEFDGWVPTPQTLHIVGELDL